MKIISGGQSGVDRAALDVAQARGLPTGGWCPKGRRAEDGPIPLRYPLEETETSAYKERTELNVRDSDATLIITKGSPAGGTAETINMAEKWQRPLRIIDLAATVDLAPVAQWLTGQEIAVLNVAGPREHTIPGIYTEATRLLRELLMMTSDTDAAHRQQAD
jgi:hypothetical protein